jgi:hypothetical protein
MPGEDTEKRVDETVARQKEPDEHDLGLIRERLSWTPEQRLAANTAFLRFYLLARPSGPMIRDE